MCYGARSNKVKIKNLEFFVTQKLCKHIPKMLQNGIETATTYGVMNISEEPPQQYQYDKHWVYTTPIHQHSTVSTFFGEQNSDRECIIRVNKEIVNDPIIRSQMMVNNGWWNGQFLPETTYLKGLQSIDGPQEAKVLYFGGNETVPLEYYWDDYSVQDKRLFMERPGFSGNINILERKIKQCLLDHRLQYDLCEYSFCEILFRTNIPLKYIDGYYEFKRSDECINVKKMKWRPLDDCIPSYISKKRSKQQTKQRKQGNDNNYNQSYKEDKEKIKNDNDKREMLTYITWNVWHNNKLELIKRMEAIGDIIELNKADIVCFQEVSPFMLDILQHGSWYTNGNYSSTILPSFGVLAGLRDFNVIMTKHEFVRDSIQFIPFSNTSRRHLIITPIKLKNNGNKIVYAATSHLEYRASDRGKEERKRQIKYSMELLDDKQFNNNVIFGGDMNWHDATKHHEDDGDLNELLNSNWTDCYNKLYPDKKGYTYDPKTNGMLSRYHQQRRLDRILYKNNGDLRLKSIQIIGKETIPNLNYVKTHKRKHKSVRKILPVLPSDHYGLKATFKIL